MKVLNTLVLLIFLSPNLFCQGDVSQDTSDTSIFNFGIYGGFYASKFVIDKPKGFNDKIILGPQYGIFVEYKLKDNIYLYSGVGAAYKGSFNHTENERTKLRYLISSIGIGFNKKELSFQGGLYYGVLRKKELIRNGVDIPNGNSSLRKMREHDLGLHFNIGGKVIKPLKIFLDVQLGIVSLGEPSYVSDLDALTVRGDWMRNLSIGLVGRYALYSK